MSKSISLPEKISDQRLALFEEGYELEQSKQFKEAERRYLKAWEILPDPKYQWDWSRQTLLDLAEFYFRGKHYDVALHWANLMFKVDLTPDDLGYSSTQFLVGKIQYEANNLSEALDHFEEAHKYGGKRVFQGEDKKYINFLLAERLKNGKNR